MVKCQDCNKEMLDKNVKSCTVGLVEIAGEAYERDRTYYDVNKRCHDCGIENKKWYQRKGNYHHCGCDMERCPRCKGQLISCDCEDGA